jgi:hypothetical protein
VFVEEWVLKSLCLFGEVYGFFWRGIFCEFLEFFFVFWNLGFLVVFCLKFPDLEHFVDFLLNFSVFYKDPRVLSKILGVLQTV